MSGENKTLTVLRMDGTESFISNVSIPDANCPGEIYHSKIALEFGTQMGRCSATMCCGAFN